MPAMWSDCITICVQVQGSTNPDYWTLLLWCFQTYIPWAYLHDGQFSKEKPHNLKSPNIPSGQDLEQVYKSKISCESFLFRDSTETRMS